jgi:protein-S-isoprenylcysteine O-methyltransferase Ste14
MAKVSLIVLWLAWWASWWLAASWTAPTTAKALAKDEIRYRVLTAIGVVLLLAPLGPISVATFVHDPSQLGSWLLVLLALAGFAFAWWARLHLGTLWSSSITRKEGHHVVDTGPYALVRHPIYTGIIAAAFATALERGTALSIFGALLMTLSFVIKARLEEQFLGAELGEETYASYRRRVPMLIPFWPFRTSA